MQCLRPQKEHSGQEELVSKVPLQAQLMHAAKFTPCDGHGTCDAEELSHTQPEVQSSEAVSKGAALKSTAASSEHLDGAAAATPQSTADGKPAQEEADGPFSARDTMVDIPEHLDDDSASKASLSAAAPEVAATRSASLLQEASGNGPAQSLIVTDGDAHDPGDVRSVSAQDERDESASVSSDTSLDCTSTPVAIGHDPFAGSKDGTAKHEEGPKFQYGSLAKSLLDEDSRPCTPEGLQKGVLIIEDAVSLISSPSLPRMHSRPYTPLKYSPQEQKAADSQPSMQDKAQRSQHTMTTNALWQGRAQVLDRKEAHTNHLTISSDRSSDDSGQRVSLTQGTSQTDRRRSRGIPADSKGRRPRHHRRKQRNAESSAPSIESNVLKAEHMNGRATHAAPAQSIVHHSLPYAEHAGMPGSGHSIDWVSEPGVALQGHDQHQCSAHSAAQLQSDLQHAQAAELHYLGTIARLSARLESSIAKEGILKQRLHQLEVSQSNQQPASHAARTAQDVGRQTWAGQLLPLRAAASRDSSVPGDNAAQQCVQHEGCVQTQRAPNPQRQKSHGSQHQSDNSHLINTQDIASTSPTTAKEPKLQQEVIDRLEGELQAVKACLARDQAELEALRSASAPAADQASGGTRRLSDKDAGLLTGAQDDAKELRSDLVKTRQRMEQFAAEARSGDQAVRKLRQEAGELKAALASSQADCNHLRQQMREANRDVKAAVAGEQELKGECHSLRMAVDAARQAVAARDAECMRLQQSLHSSRCELVELAAKHRQLERSMLAGQPQMDAAGRRSSSISAPEAPRGAKPASQPDFSPATPGHGTAHASFQASTSLPIRAGTLASAPGADMRPMQSSHDQQIGPGHPDTAYSRSAGGEQPTWHREGARAPVSTAYSGHPFTALQPFATAACSIGSSLQNGSGTPFAISEGAGQNRAGPLGVGPQCGTAPTPAHAAGRQNRKSEGSPYALTAAVPGHAVHSLPEAQSRETSPPYATHAELRSAHLPSKHAQASHTLTDSQEDSWARNGGQSLPRGDPRPARATDRPGRDEPGSAGMSADGERDSTGHLSSPRHSISSLRPYANDASLQDFRVHAQLMEDRLMTVNSENQRLHAEYARMSETSAGKTLAERRRRAEVEARLDSNTKEASNIRLQLKRLNAQSG